MVADLLKELSNHNERSEERKGALVELLKITREDNLAVWDEHFKTFLLLLLETLGDKDVGFRSAPSLFRTPFPLTSDLLCVPSRPAHHPRAGPAGVERDFKESAGPI